MCYKAPAKHGLNEKYVKCTIIDDFQKKIFFWLRNTTLLKTNKIDLEKTHLHCQ